MSTVGAVLASASTHGVAAPKIASIRPVRPSALYRPALPLRMGQQPGRDFGRRASVAARSGEDDVVAVAADAVEEEAAPKKKAKAPAKPKAPPLTEEEKAAKAEDKLIKAAEKKAEKKAAKEAAEVEAKLRLEAATSRRSQRNTVRGVVRESDMITTPGGAVVPRGKQWYGLQVRPGPF